MTRALFGLLPNFVEDRLEGAMKRELRLDHSGPGTELGRVGPQILELRNADGWDLLIATDSQRGPEARLVWKRKLMRMLYERQHSREEIVSLPEKQEIIFEADLESVEVEHNMPYVSSFEKRAEERGLQKGLRQSLQSLLEHRFGPLPSWASEQLGKASTAWLNAWMPRVLDAPKLEDVFR